MDIDTAQTIGITLVAFACMINSFSIMRDRD